MDADLRLVIDTFWLCGSIMAPVMASRFSEEAAEFEIAMEANPDGTASLRDISGALDRFSELNGTPYVNASAAVDILCHMGLSLPYHVKDVFLFPALIQDAKPVTVWMKKESSEIHADISHFLLV